MIYGPPEVVRLAVDPHEHLVQVPAPAGIRMVLDTALSDLRCEHRTEPVPPEPHGLVTNIDAALEQQILDLPQRQWIPDVHHHRQADHLG